MIPAFNISNVLPPYCGADPTLASSVSPYEVSMTELVSRFGTTPQRIEILKGLIGYRARLAQLNIRSGFQLINGSFVENCEVIRGRAPSDIDIVTFAHGPANPPLNIVQSNLDVFDPHTSKATFKCDAYFIDLNKPSELIATDSFYWFSLFSHQRDTSLWKGMLKLPLISDDDQVRLPDVAEA